MLLFVLTFLALYSALHALVFWGMHPLLAGHPALPTLTGLWMAGMILAPVLVRLLERQGYELTARGLAWVGYSWMGLVFLAASLFLLLGIWDGLTALAQLCFGRGGGWALHGPVSAALTLLAVLAAGLYGFYEATDLRVERIRLETGKLPPGVERLTIAQVSDLHLGLLHRDEALAPIVARLQELQPDLLVATGDIVDAQINHLEGLAELWRRIDPPLGKFAVTGNHEFYAGLEQSLDFLDRSGFTVLRNAGLPLASTLTLIGVDDPTRRAPSEEGALLQAAGGQRFTVLLKHRPEVAPEAVGRFDLQLSGHAHRGQMIPFNLLTGLAYPLQNGLTRLGWGGHLYASRGTGTWGPPMRIGSPPEITLFEIVPGTSP